MYNQSQTSWIYKLLNKQFQDGFCKSIFAANQNWWKSPDNQNVRKIGVQISDVQLCTDM